MNLWPHQRLALEMLDPYVQRGGAAVVLTSPTGGGKTVMARQIIHRYKPAAMFTNRRMLFTQLGEVLEADGLAVGRVASGYEGSSCADVQLCMIPTVDYRMASPGWAPPEADIVLVDEAHNDKGPRVQRIVAHYRERGATVIGMTGTPVDIGHIYTDGLIVAGKNSELRKTDPPAHVPAITYAPSEIEKDLIRKVKVNAREEGFATDEIRQVVFGSIIESYRKLNPQGLPAILFAPGVAESRWMAQQFYAQGISAAHIDGARIWINGEEMPSSEEARADVKARVANGEIRIVCNRFVLREGIDIPELSHCIFATPFGGLTSYLQAGGRVIRGCASVGKTSAIIQDHGGNWHRHGSLNADREWDVDKTDAEILSERQERMRQEKGEDVPEPIVCPACAAIRLSGPQCRKCGHMASRSVRTIIQADGSLRNMGGDIYRPRRVSTDPKGVKDWKRVFFRCKNAKNGMTFRQAEALFFREHGVYPDRRWPMMPKSASDMHAKVGDLAWSKLNSDTQPREVAHAPAQLFH